MTATAFPRLDEIVALGGSEYERDFLQLEFEPGLGYYGNRLDRIQFRGARLLDAGCGAGQWTAAAAARFARVDALDVNAPRLDVLRAVIRQMAIDNVETHQGSIEQLPFESATFDAVFCYGVIMFANVGAALAEFHRVLKPGGRVYLCLNADGWSRYLIHDRGVREPKVTSAGQQTLYNTYWRRALAAGVRQRLIESSRRAPERLLARLATLPAGDAAARTGGRMCLLDSDAGRLLFEQVHAECGPELSETLLTDAWRIATGASSAPTKPVQAEAFQPHEVAALAAAAGFADFQWGEEATLACDWLLPAPAPKYAGRFGDDLAVWEVLMTKPGPAVITAADPPVHFADARAARDERVFVEPADVTVLSTGSRDTYPRALLDRARSRARRLGGSDYLSSLASRLTTGARSDENAFRAIVRFVQRSVFRDPIAQPINDDGSLPDALTILLTARGRCSHTSALLVDLLQRAGLSSRVVQLGSHVIAEANVSGRRVIADADAFKNGVIPTNTSGMLLTLADLEANPYQIDRFQPTGWWIRERSRFTRGAGGGHVTGYVDALEPERRGFVSGYYTPSVKDYPPALPVIHTFERSGDLVRLAWTESAVRQSRYVRYRVAIGTVSRGWSYDHPGDADEILQRPSTDVFSGETPERAIEVPVMSAALPLFASVTAVSDRIELEPETFFWPSEEARWPAEPA